MTSSNYNLAAFSSVEVNFYFYPRSMENGEDFWLRYNDGSGWQTVASWARGSDFNNNTFYQATVTLDNSNVNLANGAQFRFQCDASVNNDQVYIDQVTITGFSGGNRSTGNTIALVGNSVERGDEFEFEGDFAVYPNPASDYLNVVAEEEIRSIRLYSLDGRLLQEMSVQGMSEQLDISRLNAGLYIVELQTEEELLQEKFIKH